MVAKWNAFFLFKLAIYYPKTDFNFYHGSTAFKFKNK